MRVLAGVKRERGILKPSGSSGDDTSGASPPLRAPCPLLLIVMVAPAAERAVAFVGAGRRLSVFARIDLVHRVEHLRKKECTHCNTRAHTRLIVLFNQAYQHF